MKYDQTNFEKCSTNDTEGMKNLEKEKMKI